MPAPFPTTLSRCPVCKKADPYREEAPNCPRCGCDLSKSAAAHAAAQYHINAAATSLREGDSEDALTQATYAWSLAHLPAIPPLACLAALHTRDLTELALWRSRASQKPA